MAVWATVAAVLFLGVALFQVALALGVPWGEVAYGGRAADARGRLPGRYRLISAFSALFLGFGAVVVLARGDVITLDGVTAGTLTAITWLLAAMMAVNTLANVASPSRTERMVFGGATAVLTVSCVLLALG